MERGLRPLEQRLRARMLGDEALALGFVERFEPPAVQGLHAGSMRRPVMGRSGISRDATFVHHGRDDRAPLVPGGGAPRRDAHRVRWRGLLPAASEVPEPSTVVTPAPASEPSSRRPARRPRPSSRRRPMPWPVCRGLVAAWPRIRCPCTSNRSQPRRHRWGRSRRRCREISQATTSTSRSSSRPARAGVDMDMVIARRDGLCPPGATRTGRRCRVMRPKRRSPASFRTCASSPTRWTCCTSAPRTSMAGSSTV